MTGIWDCCGSDEHHSIYCPSLEIREQFGQKLQQIEQEKKQAQLYAQMVKEERRIPWNDCKPLSIQKEDVEDISLREASEVGNAYNVLMLITWLAKNLDDEAVIQSGLKLMEAHANLGDGCVQIYRHKGIDLLDKTSTTYRSNGVIQLSVLAIFHRLLDCNFTRDSIITSPKVLNISFLIGHCYLNSVQHVEHSTCCVLQCSRNETCRQEILEKKYITYFLMYCRKYKHNHIIIRSIMKLMNWVTSNDDRLRYLYDIGAPKVVLKCMNYHLERGEVLAPCLLFLTRISKVIPEALEFLIRKKAVSTVIMALRTLYDQEVIQLEALKMLKTLSQSPEGWKQISDTRGGWQSICQGTF